MIIVGLIDSLEDLTVGLDLVLLPDDLPGAQQPLAPVPLHRPAPHLHHRSDLNSIIVMVSVIIIIKIISINEHDHDHPANCHQYYNLSRDRRQ